MTQEVDIKVQEGVQVIRLLRADKKNALTGPMYDAMSAALDAAEKSDAVAAHVFIGSGGVYTAGNDINDFMRRASAGWQGVRPTPGPLPDLPTTTASTGTTTTVPASSTTSTTIGVVPETPPDV